MSDNRKYYYLKLKENYFDEDAIVLLESMQDGILYSNILLKLYLKSLKNGGKLQLDENIPYTAQMIATITRQQVGTVERALQIFMKLGLVEPLQNGALYMSNIELLIGQSSTEGERKRRARLALQEQKALPKAGADKCPPYQADICPPEIEIEKEIEKERERELDTGQPARAAYGRYENVFLSQSELDGLKADLPGKWDYYIDRLSCISRPAASDTRAMPPPSTNGRRRTQLRKPRKRAYQTTHARRARVYEERNQRCFGEYDGHHPGAGGLHRRGRFAVLRQVPQAERSLFCAG